MSDDIKYDRSKAIGIAEKKGIKFHPACLAFPLMDEDSFQELVEDIKKNGQHVEVLQDHEGNILDGRNRVLSCLLLEIEPRYNTAKFNGQGSVADLVVSLNMNRRHLNTTQKAVVGRRLLPIYKAEAEKRRVELSGTRSNPTRQEVDPKKGQPDNESKKRGRPPGSKNRAPQASDQAAKAVGVSGSTVERAKSVFDRAPELEEEMEAGSLTLEQAKTLTQYSEEKRKELRKRKEQYNWTVPQMLKAARMEADGIAYDPVTLELIPHEPEDLTGFDENQKADSDKREQERLEKLKKISEEEDKKRYTAYKELLIAQKTLFGLEDAVVAQDLVKEEWSELSSYVRRMIFFWIDVHNILHKKDMIVVTNMRAERLS